MKIQLTQDDKPAFSRISKYIRRHWPEEIKLSKAQQITSKIMGYSSLHELQRSQVSAEAPISTMTKDEIVVSIFSKAVELYDEYDNDQLSFLINAPWRLLSICEKRNDGND